MNIALDGMYLVIMTSKVTVGVEYTELWGKLFIDMTGYKGATVAQLFQMASRFHNVKDTEILVRMPVHKDSGELSRGKVTAEITEGYKQATAIEIPGAQEKVSLIVKSVGKQGDHGELTSGIQVIKWHWLCGTLGDVESESEVHLKAQMLREIDYLGWKVIDQTSGRREPEEEEVTKATKAAKDEYDAKWEKTWNSIDPRHHKWMNDAKIKYAIDQCHGKWTLEAQILNECLVLYAPWRSIVSHEEIQSVKKNLDQIEYVAKYQRKHINVEVWQLHPVPSVYKDVFDLLDRLPKLLGLENFLDFAPHPDLLASDMSEGLPTEFVEMVAENTDPEPRQTRIPLSLFVKHAEIIIQVCEMITERIKEAPKRKTKEKTPKQPKTEKPKCMGKVAVSSLRVILKKLFGSNIKVPDHERRTYCLLSNEVFVRLSRLSTYYDYPTADEKKK
jgi:hypothetical protein